MKRSTSVTIAIITLLFLVVFQFIYNNKRVNGLKKQMYTEAAKTNFVLRQFDDQNAPFDSVHSKDDTVSFYKNSSFVGNTVIVTE